MRCRKLPTGWDEARIREVLAHYQKQTDDEQFAEIQAALQVENTRLDHRSGRTDPEGPGPVGSQSEDSSDL